MPSKSCWRDQSGKVFMWQNDRLHDEINNIALGSGNGGKNFFVKIGVQKISLSLFPGKRLFLLAT